MQLPGRDSNPRRADLQPAALPAELPSNHPSELDRHERIRTSDPSDISRVLYPLSYVSVEVESGSAQCPVPSAQCPVPSAQCPVPSAQCPVPSAQCPMPSAQKQHPLPWALGTWPWALGFRRRCHGESNPAPRRDNPVSYPLNDGTVSHLNNVSSRALPYVFSKCRIFQLPVSMARGDRTPNLRFWRPALYQLSYRHVYPSKLPRGVEPRASSLPWTRSPFELRKQSVSRGRGADPVAVPRPAAGSRVPRGGAGAGRRAALSARETFTRTHTRVFKHAGPRRSAGASCRRSVSPDAPGGCRWRLGERKAPRLHVLGGGALDPSSARSGCGYLPPQRTSSRDLCPILPKPRTASAVARRAAESITTVRTAPPATEGRRDNPTDLAPSRLIGRPHGAPLRRARLRRGPVRQRRGGGHECHMRHPEGGGGEGGGHREALLSFVSRSFGSSCFGYTVRPGAGCGFSANEKREARPDRPVSEAIPSRRPAPGGEVLR